MWEACDVVMVLSKGYELFHGRPCDAVKWFVSEGGVTRPHDISPADFIMDQANIDDTNRSKYYTGTMLENEADLEKVSDHSLNDMLVCYA